MGTYSNTIKICKDYELKLSVLMKQVTDLTAANNNLGQFKIKIEKELAIVTKDYSDIARELKLADDRANKAGSDAAHFESLLREEQNKLVKIDGAKKALENECRSLSVRIEEIETNSVATSKRTIEKMEIRIQELEIMINEEKKLHVASMSEIQIRNRQIKEFVLQSEEDRKNIIILQESLEKLNEKIKMYKRQLEEQESISNSNIMRVKSSRGSLRVLNPGPRRLNLLLTSSDPERECLLLLLPGVRRFLTFRNPRLLSRRPSTKSASPAEAPPPWPSPLAHQLQPQSPPVLLSQHPETSGPDPSLTAGPDLLPGLDPRTVPAVWPEQAP